MISSRFKDIKESIFFDSCNKGENEKERKNEKDKERETESDLNDMKTREIKKDKDK